MFHNLTTGSSGGPCRLRTAAAAVVVAAMIVVTSATATPIPVVAAAGVAPATHRAAVVSGLHVFAINGRQYGVRKAVHVLTFSGSQYAVKIGLAHNAIDGGRQTTSTICRTTVGCVAAVNADYFDIPPPGEPDPGDEVGGIIQNCVLLHTPEIAHQQADLDGQSVSNGLNWTSALDVNGVSVPITAINQELPMSYLNVNLPLAGTLLFAAPYSLQTPTAPGWVTYQFTQVAATASPTTINTTAQLEFVAQTSAAVRVRAGQVDITAATGSTLDTLQAGDMVALTTTSTAGCDNIGGHPILLNKGIVTPVVRADTYLVKPYARTVIGWTASGETVIMTVDGKDGVSGATAFQLDELLQSLDVVTALDLDGGESTTFFAKGRVLNIPSHVSERPVSTALLVVANS
ncbi:MAG: phosphodiester glycosidase family protein [Acidimicrobiales bacterium]